MNQSRVQQNFTALARRGVKLIPRVPLIPSFTLTIENMQQILDFLRPFNLTEIHLLPFHKYGEAKYPLLDKPYSMHKIKVPDDATVAPFYTMAEKYGYNVTLGG